VSYRIFLDLDGVMADFDAHHLACSPGGVKLNYDADKAKWWSVVMDTPDFWLNIPLKHDARKLWNFLMRTRLPVEVLSAPSVSDRERAIAQKSEWVRQHLCTEVPLNFREGAQKHEFAAPDAILIDDWDSNVRRWAKAGGIAILHRTAEDTIAQLRALGICV
jgi:hypothetical protein